MKLINAIAVATLTITLIGCGDLQGLSDSVEKALETATEEVEQTQTELETDIEEFETAEEPTSFTLGDYDGRYYTGLYDVILVVDEENNDIEYRSYGPNAESSFIENFNLGMRFKSNITVDGVEYETDAIANSEGFVVLHWYTNDRDQRCLHIYDGIIEKKADSVNLDD